MAKKISDHTADTLAPTDWLAFYRPGSPSADLRGAASAFATAAQGAKADAALQSPLAADVNCADQVLSRPELKDYSETRTLPSSSAGTLVLDMELGNAFQVTLTEDVTTLTLSNPPGTNRIGTIFLILIQDGTGAWGVTWPASVKWPDGVAPVLSQGPGDVDIITLVTPNAGTTWYGFIGGLNFLAPA